MSTRSPLARTRSTTIATMRAIAREEVRTFSTGMMRPPRTVRIGLMARADPSSADAAPMRPPATQVLERVDVEEHRRLLQPRARSCHDGLRRPAPGAPSGESPCAATSAAAMTA